MFCDTIRRFHETKGILTMIDKTVCELFAGVGGFRCGLNSIKSINETEKNSGKLEKWETVYFSQWEPADKKTQWAHDCYVNRFGTCCDLNFIVGKDILSLILALSFSILIV